MYNEKAEIWNVEMWSYVLEGQRARRMTVNHRGRLYIPMVSSVVTKAFWRRFMFYCNNEQLHAHSSVQYSNNGIELKII